MRAFKFFGVLKNIEMLYKLSKLVNLVLGQHNPISSNVWNDVIWQDRVNLTRKCYGLPKYQKQTQNGRNLFLTVHFDI